MIKNKIENFIEKVVGNYNYEEVKEIPQKELYTYYKINNEDNILNFYIYSEKEFVVEIITLPKYQSKLYRFFNQNLKKYFHDYSEKSDGRQFSAILLESGRILLNVRDRKFNVIRDEMVPLDTEKIYRCFTREDFKPINLYND